jgi:hypothetical protein
MIVVHLAGCALSFILLLGTYQNKARLVYLWVIMNLTILIVGQLVTIVELVTVFEPSKFVGNSIGLGKYNFTICYRYSITDIISRTPLLVIILVPGTELRSASV